MPKKKIPIRAVLAAVLFLIGLGIALFPHAKAWYMNRQAGQIVQDFRDMLQNTPEPTPEQTELPQTNTQTPSPTPEAVEPVMTPMPTITPQSETVVGAVNTGDYIATWESDASKQEYLRENMEGILTIPKIQLELPVLRKDTEFNLKIGLASLDYAAQIGQKGNYCVAGHRARARGRQFNRLNELEFGDLVIATSHTHMYTYEVYDKILVKDDEMWVTEPHQTYESIITLITCDYRIKPSGRLIVFGKLIEVKELGS